MFNFMKREKMRRPEDISKISSTAFSEPITIYLNKVKSVGGGISKSPVEAIVELTPYTVTCLKDAINLNRLIVRDVTRRSTPMVGDIVCVIEDDPSDVYRQVIFEIAKRGKV